jgi:tripartite-type tricarboxylate transporter receptor subunit TctC
MRIPSIVATTMMLAATTVAGFAQDWPARPMTLVVTFAAGSGDDLLARIISPRLSANRSSLKMWGAPAA